MCTHIDVHVCESKKRGRFRVTQEGILVHEIPQSTAKGLCVPSDVSQKVG